MINYLLAVLLLLSFGCNQPKDSNNSGDTPTVEQPIPNSPSGEPPIVHEPDVEPTPVPSAPGSVNQAPPSPEELFSTSGVTFKDAGSDQLAKYKKALVIVKKVILNPKFKEQILAHKKLDGSKGFENTSDSNDKVYQTLMNCAETLNKKIDHETDLEVRFYYASNSTVGYTYPNVSYIMVNTKFFNGYTPSSVAANFIHEYLHKLGYGHDSARTTRRPYSVPYGIGSIMRSLGKQYE